jgi:enoyl-CoA hydratase/carnithine racemase
VVEHAVRFVSGRIGTACAADSLTLALLAGDPAARGVSGMAICDPTLRRPGLDTTMTAPETSAVQMTLDDGVATLSFNGSKSLNVLGTPLIEALTAALARLHDDASLRVLVLRGAGDRAFSGGADVREMAALTPDSAAPFITRLKALCDALRALPVPVLARLPGWCLGAGLEIAASCDLRVASADAKFGMPEVRVGIPSVIHAALLPRLIGQSAAAWLLFTGEAIDADTAHRWGLLHRVVPLRELDAAVSATARHLAALGPAVLRQQKALLRAWETMPLDDAMNASVREFARAFVSGEPQRFMARFNQRG